MLVFVLSFGWDQRTDIFQLYGFYCVGIGLLGHLELQATCNRLLNCTLKPSSGIP